MSFYFNMQLSLAGILAKTDWSCSNGAVCEAALCVSEEAHISLHLPWLVAVTDV